LGNSERSERTSHIGWQYTLGQLDYVAPASGRQWAAETAALPSCNKTQAGIRNHLPGYPAFVFCDAREAFVLCSDIAGHYRSLPISALDKALNSPFRNLLFFLPTSHTDLPP
jgi:hypothetical protein